MKFFLLLFISFVLNAQFYIGGGLSFTSYNVDTDITHKGNLDKKIQIGFKSEHLLAELTYTTYRIKSEFNESFNRGISREGTIDHEYLQFGLKYRYPYSSLLNISSGIKVAYHISSHESFVRTWTEYIDGDIPNLVKAKSDVELKHLKELNLVFTLENEFHLYKSLTGVLEFEHWLNPIFYDVESYKDNIDTFYLYSFAFLIRANF